MRFRLIPGGGESDSTSDGGQLQCDCTASGCPCTRWGVWVPKGKPIPSEVRCDQCQSGNHSG